MTCSFRPQVCVNRSIVVAFLLGSLTLAPDPILAQNGGLQSSFRDLFKFGDGCGPEVLFCLQSGGDVSDFAQNAFSTTANATAKDLTLFLQSAIALGIANVPAPSAGSGETFRLSALGVPVRSEEKSLGPIFAERALTLGKGNLLVGANVTDLHFQSLRGISLEDLQLNVMQRDLPPAGPPLGNPTIEQTYLAVTTRMALDARVANLFLSYGVTDRLDLSVLVPIAHLSLSGFSEAEIVIGEGQDPAAGFSFGGPAGDPRLRDFNEVPPAKATGLGDISLRGKYRFSEIESRWGLALLGDLRLPTGREEDFLGSPGAWIQGLGILSLEAGAGFTPHINSGFVFRSGEGQRNAVNFALGFDHRTSDRITFAAEILSQVPLGSNPFVQEEVVIGDAQGIQTTILSSNIPTLRDSQFDGAVGVKLRLGKLALLGNAIVPLNDGGLRGDVLWTVGLQGGF